jgi:hypothetical protein
VVDLGVGSRITSGFNEPTIAYLPVVIRSLRTLQVEALERDPDA